MYFSSYRVKNNSQIMQSAFRGLNKNARIGDGEFSDMTNMSGDCAPLLSPRQPRTKAQKVSETIENPITNEDGSTTVETTTEYKNLNGILGDVGFAAVWGNDFYYMGKKVDGITLDNGEKKLLAMGTTVLIFPDGVYYDTLSGESGSVETGTVYENEVYIDADTAFVLDDGRASSDFIDVDYTPTGSGSAGRTTSMRLYLNFVNSPDDTIIIYYPDYNQFGNSLKRIPTRVRNGYIEYLYKCNISSYHTSNSSTRHDKYLAGGREWRILPIKKIVLSNVPQLNSNNVWSNGERVTFANNVLTLKKPGYIGPFLSNILTENTKTSSTKAWMRWTSKNFPVFDHVCVHENRVWGCRYGEQVDGSTFVNEIYCSKLGDFKTWTLSSATTTLAGDPYVLNVGEYGAFTGCVSLRGQLLFFKDNIVYRVSGDKPSNFRIDKISESGLQSGCEKSLEIIDEILYYKSRNGVFAYDGSIPQKISDALGNFYYTDAVAGKHFSKYYISMVTGGVRKLYVYDTRTGLWHAEDDADIRFFTEYDGALYGGIDNEIVCLSGSPATIFADKEVEKAVEWCVETGDIGLDSPYQKYLRRLLIRMEMDKGASVIVEILGDDGEWYTAMKYVSPHKRTFMMPVSTPRVDHARIRISGRGYAKIYSVSYEVESAGDRYIESYKQKETARKNGTATKEIAVKRNEFFKE